MTDKRRQQGQHKPSVERDAPSDLVPLSPRRLAEIAALLPEKERAAFAISIDPDLVNLFLEESLKLTKEIVIDDRLDRHQLRDAINRLDQAAALQPKPAPELRLDTLTPAQLTRVAACTSREDYEALAAELQASGQPEPAQQRR